MVVTCTVERREERLNSAAQPEGGGGQVAPAARMASTCDWMLGRGGHMPSPVFMHCTQQDTHQSLREDRMEGCSIQHVPDKQQLQAYWQG